MYNRTMEDVEEEEGAMRRVGSARGSEPQGGMTWEGRREGGSVQGKEGCGW